MTIRSTREARELPHFSPPLPHPSWAETDPDKKPDERPPLSAKEFWSRLGE